MSTTAPLMSARGISKSFAGNTVLHDLDLDIHPGTVHALLGHNGSGKSTFIKILAGFHAPDSTGGEIELGGERLQWEDPDSSAALGLSFVHQTLGLIPDLSIQENLRLNTPWSRGKLGQIDWRRDTQKATASLQSFGVDLDPRTEVSRLSAAERSEVAIVRALIVGEKIQVLVLDEPTAALTNDEVDKLFATIKRVTSRGVGVLYVTHRLEELSRIADEVSVLRDGRVVARGETKSFANSELLNLVTGLDTGLKAPGAPAGAPTEVPAAASAAGTARETLHLEVANAGSLREVSLDVRSGDIVGVVGLVGAGPNDLASAIAGSVRSTSTCRVGTAQAPLGNTHRLRRIGVSLVVGHRTQRVLTGMSVKENATISVIRKLWRGGFLRERAERRLAEDTVSRFGIRTSGIDQEAQLLSGGNQQKLAVARAILTSPKFLVLEEPFHGVDARGRREIGETIRRGAAEGMGILIVDTDLDELIGVCTRVEVMRDGRVVKRFSGSDMTRANLLSAYYGTGDDSDVH